MLADTAQSRGDLVPECGLVPGCGVWLPGQELGRVPCSDEGCVLPLGWLTTKQTLNTRSLYAFLCESKILFWVCFS